MHELLKSFRLQNYIELKNIKLAKSIASLFLFMFFVSILFSFKTTLFINRALPNLSYKTKQLLKKNVTDIPKIEIKDGVTIMPEEKYQKNWKNLSLIIDSKETDPYSILNESDNIVGLTKENIIIKSKKEEYESDVKVYELNKLKELLITPIDDGLNIVSGDFNFDITPDSIDKGVKRFTKVAFPLFLVLFLILFFPSKLTQILSFSILSIVLNRRLKARLNYKELLNIGIYAIIPPTTLSLITILLNVSLPFFWILYPILYIIIVYKAIQVNIFKKKSTELEIESKETDFS